MIGRRMTGKGSSKAKCGCHIKKSVKYQRHSSCQQWTKAFSGHLTAELGPSTESWFEKLSIAHQTRREVFDKENNFTDWSPCPAGGILNISAAVGTTSPTYAVLEPRLDRLAQNDSSGFWPSPLANSSAWNQTSNKLLALSMDSAESSWSSSLATPSNNLFAKPPLQIERHKGPARVLFSPDVSTVESGLHESSLDITVQEEEASLSFSETNVTVCCTEAFNTLTPTYINACPKNFDNNRDSNRSLVASDISKSVEIHCEENYFSPGAVLNGKKLRSPHSKSRNTIYPGSPLSKNVSQLLDDEMNVGDGLVCSTPKSTSRRSSCFHDFQSFPFSRTSTPKINKSLSPSIMRENVFHSTPVSLKQLSVSSHNTSFHNRFQNKKGMEHCAKPQGKRHVQRQENRCSRVFKGEDEFDRVHAKTPNSDPVGSHDSSSRNNNTHSIMPVEDSENLSMISIAQSVDLEQCDHENQVSFPQQKKLSSQKCHSQKNLISSFAGTDFEQGTTVDSALAEFFSSPDTEAKQRRKAPCRQKRNRVATSRDASEQDLTDCSMLNKSIKVNFSEEQNNITSDTSKKDIIIFNQSNQEKNISVENGGGDSFSASSKNKSISSFISSQSKLTPPMSILCSTSKKERMTSSSKKVRFAIDFCDLKSEAKNIEVEDLGSSSLENKKDQRVSALICIDSRFLNSRSDIPFLSKNNDSPTPNVCAVGHITEGICAAENAQTNLQFPDGGHEELTTDVNQEKSHTLPLHFSHASNISDLSCEVKNAPIIVHTCCSSKLQEQVSAVMSDEDIGYPEREIPFVSAHLRTRSSSIITEIQTETEPHPTKFDNPPADGMCVAPLMQSTDDKPKVRFSLKKSRKFLYPSSSQILKTCPERVYTFKSSVDKPTPESSIQISTTKEMDMNLIPQVVHLTENGVKELDLTCDNLLPCPTNLDNKQSCLVRNNIISSADSKSIHSQETRDEIIVGTVMDEIHFDFTSRSNIGHKTVSQASHTYMTNTAATSLTGVAQTSMKDNMKDASHVNHSNCTDIVHSYDVEVAHSNIGGASHTTVAPSVQDESEAEPEWSDFDSCLINTVQKKDLITSSFTSKTNLLEQSEMTIVTNNCKQPLASILVSTPGSMLSSLVTPKKAKEVDQFVKQSSVSNVMKMEPVKMHQMSLQTSASKTYPPESIGLNDTSTSAVCPTEILAAETTDVSVSPSTSPQSNFSLNLTETPEISVQRSALQTALTSEPDQCSHLEMEDIHELFDADFSQLELSTLKGPKENGQQTDSNECQLVQAGLAAGSGHVYTSVNIGSCSDDARGVNTVVSVLPVVHAKTDSVTSVHSFVNHEINVTVRTESPIHNITSSFSNQQNTADAESRSFVTVTPLSSGSNETEVTIPCVGFITAKGKVLTISSKGEDKAMKMWKAVEKELSQGSFSNSYALSDTDYADFDTVHDIFIRKDEKHGFVDTVIPDILCVNNPSFSSTTENFISKHTTVADSITSHPSFSSTTENFISKHTTVADSLTSHPLFTIAKTEFDSLDTAFFQPSVRSASFTSNQAEYLPVNESSLSSTSVHTSVPDSLTVNNSPLHISNTEFGSGVTALPNKPSVSSVSFTSVCTDFMNLDVLRLTSGANPVTEGTPLTNIATGFTTAKGNPLALSFKGQQKAVEMWNALEKEFCADAFSEDLALSFEERYLEQQNLKENTRHRGGLNNRLTVSTAHHQSKSCTISKPNTQLTASDSFHSIPKGFRPFKVPKKIYSETKTQTCTESACEQSLEKKITSIVARVSECALGNESRLIKSNGAEIGNCEKIPPESLLMSHHQDKEFCTHSNMLSDSYAKNCDQFMNSERSFAQKRKHSDDFSDGDEENWGTCGQQQSIEPHTNEFNKPQNGGLNSIITAGASNICDEQQIMESAIDQCNGHGGDGLHSSFDAAVISASMNGASDSITPLPCLRKDDSIIVPSDSGDYFDPSKGLQHAGNGADNVGIEQNIHGFDGIQSPCDASKCSSTRLQKELCGTLPSGNNQNIICTVKMNQFGNMSSSCSFLQSDVQKPESYVEAPDELSDAILSELSHDMVDKEKDGKFDNGVLISTVCRSHVFSQAPKKNLTSSCEKLLLEKCPASHRILCKNKPDFQLLEGQETSFQDVCSITDQRLQSTKLLFSIADIKKSQTESCTANKYQNTRCTSLTPGDTCFLEEELLCAFDDESFDSMRKEEHSFLKDKGSNASHVDVASDLSLEHEVQSNSGTELITVNPDISCFEMTLDKSCTNKNFEDISLSDTSWDEPAGHTADGSKMEITKNYADFGMTEIKEDMDLSPVETEHHDESENTDLSYFDRGSEFSQVEVMGGVMWMETKIQETNTGQCLQSDICVPSFHEHCSGLSLNKNIKTEVTNQNISLADVEIEHSDLASKPCTSFRQISKCKYSEDCLKQVDVSPVDSLANLSWTELTGLPMDEQEIEGMSQTNASGLLDNDKHYNVLANPQSYQITCLPKDNTTLHICNKHTHVYTYSDTDNKLICSDGIQQFNARTEFKNFNFHTACGNQANVSETSFDIVGEILKEDLECSGSINVCRNGQNPADTMLVVNKMVAVPEQSTTDLQCKENRATSTAHVNKSRKHNFGESDPFPFPKRKKTDTLKNPLLNTTNVINDLQLSMTGVQMLELSVLPNELGFQTAHGKPLSLTENSLRRANNLSQDSSYADAEGIHLVDTKTCDKGAENLLTNTVDVMESELSHSSYDGAQNENASHHAITSLDNSSVLPQHLGFQTTSEGAITVYDQCLSHARRVLGSEVAVTDSLNNQTEIANIANSDPLATEVKQFLLSDTLPDDAARNISEHTGEAAIFQKVYVPGHSSIPGIGLQTAKGEEVKNSEKNLLYAQNIFGSKGEKPDKDEIYSKEISEAESLEKDGLNLQADTELAQTLTNNFVIQVDEERTLDTSDNAVTLTEKVLCIEIPCTKIHNNNGNRALSLTDVPESTLSGFQTAGGKNVSVSTKALIQAREVLDASKDHTLDVHQHGLVSCNIKRSEMFCSEDVKVSFAQRSSNFGFQTAGGKNVSVSAKALINARKFLKHDEDHNINVNEDLFDNFNTKITNSEDVKVSHAQRSSNFGFQTAGGKNVSVSAKALMNARKILESDEDQLNVNEERVDDFNTKIDCEDVKASLAQRSSNFRFQTAGGKNVNVSSRALMNARKILESGEDHLNANEEISDIGNADIINYEHIKTSLAQQSGNFSFQTAGGKNVDVSAKALMNARKILESGEDHLNVSKDRCDNFSIKMTDGEDIKTRLTEQFSNFGFQTAGGKNVSVSAKALTNARKILESDVDHNLDINQERLENSSKINNSCCKNVQACLAKKQQSNNVGFQTDGRKSVCVFKENPDKSQEVLDHIQITSEVSQNNFHGKRILEPITFFPEEKCKTVEQAVLPVCSYGFQTASGERISVSEKSLSHVKIMFESADKSPAQIQDIRSLDQAQTSVAESIGLQTVEASEVSTPNKALQHVKPLYTCPDSVQESALTPARSMDKVENSYSERSDLTCAEMLNYNSNQLPEVQVIDDKDSLQTADNWQKSGEILSDHSSKTMKLCSALTKDIMIVIPTPEHSPLPSAVFNGYKMSSFKPPYKRSRFISPQINNPSCHKKSTESMENPQICISPKSDGSYKTTVMKTTVVQASMDKTFEVVGQEDSTGSWRKEMQHRTQSKSSCQIFEPEQSDSIIFRDGTKSVQENESLDQSALTQSTVTLEEAKLLQDKIIRLKKKERVRPVQGRWLSFKLNRQQKKFKDLLYPVAEKLSRQELIAAGVKPEVLSISSRNAGDFRFYLPAYFAGVNFMFIGDGALLIGDKFGFAGKEEFYRAFLTLNGVDPTLISDIWVYNHYRWLVWKLAAYEVVLPNIFASKALNPDIVMLQLKYRYDREIDGCQRSALKRILERDDTACKRLVLCICDIHDSGDSGEKMLEVTDGWYSMPCKSDAALKALIERKRLTLGHKIIVSGAELLGSQEACSPLEIPAGLHLKISTNSTRPAPAFSKLGYHHCPLPLCVPVSSLFAGGGLIGCVDVVVVRKYPLMFMEKQENGSNVFRTAEMEAKVRDQYEEKREAMIERLYAKLQLEIEKEQYANKVKHRHSMNECEVRELTTGAEISDAVDKSLQPEDLQSMLSNSQLERLVEYRRWQQEEHQQLLQTRMKQALADSSVQSERVVVSLQKYRVAGCCRQDIDKKASVMLTVWRPGADWEAVQEGKRYCMYSLAASLSRSCLGKGSELQVTAGRQTQLQLMNIEENLLDLVYEPREIWNVACLRQRSPLFREFDFVGIVVCSKTGRYGSDVLYVVDINGDILLIWIWGGIQAFCLQDMLKEGTTLTVSNLQLRSEHKQLVEASASLEMSHFSTLGRTAEEKHLLESMRLVKGELLRQAKERLTGLISSCTSGHEIVDSCSLDKQMSLPSGQDSHAVSMCSTSIKSGPICKQQPSISVELQNSSVSVEMKKKTAMQKLKLARLQSYGKPPPLPMLTVTKSPAATKAFKPLTPCRTQVVDSESSKKQ